MKKTVLCIVVLLAAGFFLFSRQPITTPSPSPSSPPNTPTTRPSPPKSIAIPYNNKDYVAYHALLSGKQIMVIPNFTEKKTAQTIVKENDCSIALNGGFYTKTSQPLGLLIIDGEKYGNVSADRSILTGFFYLDANGQPHVSGQTNPDAQTIFQAGPLIINNKPFSTTKDEQARRVLIAEDIDGNVHALAIVYKDSTYSGPLLSELPPLLFSIKEPFQVKQALNLDGGSASFFYEKGGVHLTEQTNIGSLICVK